MRRRPSPPPQPEPPPPAPRPRRFEVATSAIVPRPREIVWEEYATDGHPAWSDHPAGEGPALPVGDLRGLKEGAVTLSLGLGEHGLSRAMVHAIRTVTPGYLVESDTIVTGVLELRETIRFNDHPDGGTFVSIHYAVSTAAVTDHREARLNHNLGRLQRGYLERAQTWRPGDRHKPNIIHPEADDLPR